MNEEIKSGEIYKHFKGGKYKIVAVAQDFRANFNDIASGKHKVICHARDCENIELEYDVLEQLCDDERFLKGTILINNCNNQKRFIIYEALYEGEFPIGTIWARSIEDFCGYKEFPDGTEIRRFERIE